VNPPHAGVHQRFLVAGVPSTSWPAAVAELVRVTRPGGWVELTEIPWVIRGAGRTTERLLAIGQEMAAARGLDAGEEVFISLDRYLRDAGLRDVGRKEVLLPIGANVDFVGKRQQRELDLTD
jgi:hypothetical protein